MSSLVSGITKVFSSIGGGVAKLGSAVKAVGASLFTASAATGSGLANSGGLLSSLTGGGGGVLSNIISGAVRQGLSGGLVGGLVGAVTGEGFGSGFKQGALTGAITGGVGGLLAPAAAPAGIDTMTTGSTSPVVAANTPTGGAPNIGPGRGTSPGGPLIRGLGTAAATEPGAGGGGFLGALGFGEGGFMRTEGGSGLLAGLGYGAGQIYEAKAAEERAAEERKFLRKKEKRITESYDIADSAFGGGPVNDTTPRPTPSVAWATNAYEYDPIDGMVKKRAA